MPFILVVNKIDVDLKVRISFVIKIEGAHIEKKTYPEKITPQTVKS